MKPGEPMTTLEVTLLCSSILFFILWLWSSVIVARTTRALEFANLTNSKHNLAYTTLEQWKAQLEVQKAMIDDLQNMNEKLSSYNHRLNDLNAAVRTKVERIDKNTLKL